jgi:hypothetical protein
VATTTTVAPVTDFYANQTILSATLNSNCPEAVGSLEFRVNGDLVNTVPVNGNGTYSTPYLLNQAPGNYTITANFISSNPFYLNSNGSNTLTINKAPSAFSNLSQPVVIVRTLQTQISGRIVAGNVIPVGQQVLVAINGLSGTITELAQIQADGTFSIWVATQGLNVTNPGYVINFSYAGDQYFAQTNSSSLLKVVYGNKVLSNQTAFSYPGSTVQVRIQAVDVFGSNMSNSNMQVLATGVRLLPNGASSPVTNSGVNMFPRNAFFATTVNGQLVYQFNVQTASNWQTGTYEIAYTIGTDPTVHTAQFRVDFTSEI